MTEEQQGRKFRTAVLVVHGMGSQRPLDTVRGIVDAVWRDGKSDAETKRRIWTHPEQSGVDIDLTVMTTSSLTGNPGGRTADFHELYWAHLMSETRAVAVLLWLFELARRGPRLRPSIGPLYWATVIFLCLLCLSVSLLAIQLVLQFVERVPHISDKSFSMLGDSHSLVFVILIIIGVASGISFAVASFKWACKLAIPSFILSAISIGLFIVAYNHQDLAEPMTNLLLPAAFAALLARVTMGQWGLAGLGITLILSGIAFWIVLAIFAHGSAPSWWLPDFAEAYQKGWIPWSISSFWSSIAACFFIVLYLAMYAGFLQPFLGDAARYFRNSPANVAVRREIRKQSVDTLDRLHTSGDYDRIVVVAHSLGTVVAYDMLRAYYSRINQALPRSIMAADSFKKVDDGLSNGADARKQGREIVRAMHEAIAATRQRIKAGAPQPGDIDLRAWLVTDFVTLGSPLTHAHYLMCNGNSAQALEDDFERRTREREFPTCPPCRLDNDKLVTFQDPNDTKIRYFHHGGLFALTRWTNLYFKVSQLFWGDAVGGPLADLFGDPKAMKINPASGKHIADVEVWTNRGRTASFFSHIKYWDIAEPDRYSAPQIEALCRAVDLADTGEANGL